MGLALFVQGAWVIRNLRQESLFTAKALFFFYLVTVRKEVYAYGFHFSITKHFHNMFIRFLLVNTVIITHSSTCKFNENTFIIQIKAIPYEN